MMHKKAPKQFAENKQTKDMDYWNRTGELQFIEGTMNANMYCLWHTEAEQDPLPSETGPQGSVPTW